MRAELAVALGVLAQGAILGAPEAMLVALACVVAWRIPALRHGVASAAMGGLGMLIGAWLDGGGACHAGPAIGFATAGMVVACSASCVWVCGASGRPRFDPVLHGVALASMFFGEEAARAGATLAGRTAGHGVLVLGMGVGTAIGAAVAGLLRASDANVSG
jgi:hypothetical protein